MRELSRSYIDAVDVSIPAVQGIPDQSRDRPSDRQRIVSIPAVQGIPDQSTDKFTAEAVAVSIPAVQGIPDQLCIALMIWVYSVSIPAVQGIPDQFKTFAAASVALFLSLPCRGYLINSGTKMDVASSSFYPCRAGDT